MERRRFQRKDSSYADIQIGLGLRSSNICPVAIRGLVKFAKQVINQRDKSITLRPRCTPSRVGWTYNGQHSSMNFAKQKKASNSEGMVYRNGAANTFIPWTYVKPSCWVSCLSARVIDLCHLMVITVELTMTTPHKSIQQPDEHVLSYPLLEPSICRKGPKRCIGTLVKN